MAAPACEIREMLDTIRDSDSTCSLSYLVPALVGLLQSGEHAFQKDTVDYQFRQVLFEILNHLPVNESIQTHVNSIFNCMLHHDILRHDNEENGVTACKTLVDLVRSYQILVDEGLKEFIAIFYEVFRYMKGPSLKIPHYSTPTPHSQLYVVSKCWVKWAWLW